jgi:hypothetical protein
MGLAKQVGSYPAEWPSIARLVKEEAGWLCVRCGHPHDVASGHVLTVHHFTGDKCCNERFNLMALCQRCHLSIQARVNPRVPIMFDATPWSMPYIAGLYEAGMCAVSPAYNLRRWIRFYERAVGPWPHWAPRPQAKEAV